MARVHSFWDGVVVGPAWEKPAEKVAAPLEKEPESSLTCGICGKEYKDSFWYNRHMHLVHQVEEK